MKSEHLLNAEKIARDATALAERERVRDAVAETIRNETKPGGMIYEHCKGRVTLGVDDFFIARAGVAHIGGAVMKSGIHEEDPNIQVLEQLRKVMRVPDGENIVTHAKILRALADALIDLQNSTFC